MTTASGQDLGQALHGRLVPGLLGEVGAERADPPALLLDQAEHAGHLEPHREARLGLEVELELPLPKREQLGEAASLLEEHA